ncbi:hypothetical protein TOPH_08529 [Tolypocladium ophioglossoides CBS 100239]|uniref:Hypervirulence associated protein TUDOR domain-containing protein n=1 Tax=Tolypocladium ophioglossoides (strain CBS 100239) TaxID=1163406 RepID=A0A0L0MYC0_TOLOC|nr:hypothetical protein TOPH_08529 [Tolypocladium ophioglossoides CBS 100239]
MKGKTVQFRPKRDSAKSNIERHSEPQLTKMKDPSTVIEEFNELVNIAPAELESWLKSDDSKSAGWPKEGEDGESVGHNSGSQIVEILKSNPGKDADNKRHLAQEEKAHREKPTEEVKKTKSYASLKNWGHDILKEKNETSGESKKDNKDDSEKQTGDKRKVPEDDSGSNKKREVEKGRAIDGGEGSGDKVNKTNVTELDDGDNYMDEDSSKPTKGLEVGETVSWNWGHGQPEGKVLDVKGEKTTIETKKGNEVSRNGEPEDPAVVINAGKSKVIKLAHELN